MGDDEEFEGIDADTEDIRDKLSGKKDKLSWKMDRKRRLAVIGVIGVLLVGVLAYSFAPDDLGERISDAGEQVSQASTSGGPDASEVEGEIVEVVVDDERASPHRPEIAPEDAVRFVNEASYGLEFTFRIADEEFVLEQGDSRIVKDLSAPDYYTATPVEDVEFRDISAGVNIQ